jgi:hypothetical protein
MASKRGSTKKKNGKAYIVGDWLTDIESSSGSSSSEEENDEKVAAIAGDFSSPPPSPSSTSHLCLMARGERKVQNDIDITDDSVLELALLDKMIQQESERNANKVLTRDGDCSVNPASQGHCTRVFIGG